MDASKTPNRMLTLVDILERQGDARRAYMDYWILGPLQVQTDDGQLHRLEPLQKRVLAVLLLTPNEIVPWRQLIDGVWDSSPPATAKRQVQNCVSTLRRRLVSGQTSARVIDGDRVGYRIRVDASMLDASRFQDLLAQAQTALASGQAAAAVERLRSALGLWRGPALAGMDGRVIEAGAARLDEQRLTAEEQRLDLELTLGRHRGAVAELSELVLANPLGERLVGLLMRALHASGRRADALAAYQQARTRLADELGINPSAELQQLHTSLLRDRLEPAADISEPQVTPVVPGREPAQCTTADQAVLVERDKELDQIAIAASAAAPPSHTLTRRARKRGRAVVGVMALTLLIAGMVAGGQLPRSAPQQPVVGSSATLSATVLDRPITVTVERQADRAIVRWSDPSGGTAQPIIVGAPKYEALRRYAVPGQGATQAVVTGLDPAKTYCFAVMLAYSADDHSESAEVCSQP